jgi:high-affinity nickel-transport protein
MFPILSELFSDNPATLRSRVIGLYALLALFNLGGWGWALLLFHAQPVLLGTALLAYGLGLRHAVDADHIAAIDNVTRKLMQDGQRPAAVGFFFALGHSSIVILATAALALAAGAVKEWLPAVQSLGGTIGTLVSALFLLAIAAMNLAVLLAVYRSYHAVKSGAAYDEASLDTLLSGRGFLARLLRPLFRIIQRSWHMYPLGVLFGLGFDTATEIGLLGLSAAQISSGLPIWSILVFPALFTAGMSLVDTTDGLLMLRAYGWAFLEPMRKLRYNMAITLLSAAVALGIGGVEALGLLGDRLGLSGRLWDWIGAVNDQLGLIGYAVIGSFLLIWAGAVAFYRAQGYHRPESETAGTLPWNASPSRSRKSC